MKSVKEGMFIRTWPGGLVAMVERLGLHVSVVKTGADGPCYSVPTRSMIPATRAQIVDAGFNGVGCAEPPE